MALTLDEIKSKVKERFENNPKVRVNVSITRPRLRLRGDEALITGVYPNVFRLEEYSSGAPKSHTLQYTDILTKRIEIIGLWDEE